MLIVLWAYDAYTNIAGDFSVLFGTKIRFMTIIDPRVYSINSESKDLFPLIVITLVQEDIRYSYMF